ncbi:MAG: acetyl-CoA carboxylase, biotin carboxyl carrier protein [Kiritimatiellaceae bacterium]|nr:acetyl-CoA carboxylase, biotin carboxyl carrier protein [Kiritimatiellaceae bacterium]RZO82947.1 MAG: acetyl-CoA carboxylase biotin carboxyl carrier protein [Kiritimatiellaceae bacterium]|tara:strand:- start:2375 stop:2830 length:456 start_codon:yes stop_codon:yes gene_type:complete
MDISEIKRIVKLMEEKGLTEFSMKDANGELLLKRGGGEPQVVYSAPPAVAAAPVAAAPAAAPAEAAAPAPSNLLEITSPMVGTFYRKPAPDKPAHVNEGDAVGESSTVCIVEAMKVMNEIAAEVSGTIVEVLVEDGAPVQFGQPLFTVEPK